VGFAADLPLNDNGLVHSARAGFEFRQGLVLLQLSDLGIARSMGHHAGGLGLGPLLYACDYFCAIRGLSSKLY